VPKYSNRRQRTKQQIAQHNRPRQTLRRQQQPQIAWFLHSQRSILEAFYRNFMRHFINRFQPLFPF
jgi:hypothetical protein